MNHPDRPHYIHMRHPDGRVERESGPNQLSSDEAKATSYRLEVVGPGQLRSPIEPFSEESPSEDLKQAPEADLSPAKTREPESLGAPSAELPALAGTVDRSG